MSYKQEKMKIKNSELFNVEGLNKDISLLYVDHFGEFPQVHHEHVMVRIDETKNYFLEHPDWTVVNIDIGYTDLGGRPTYDDNGNDEVDFTDDEQLYNKYSNDMIFYNPNVGFVDLMGTFKEAQFLDFDPEGEEEDELEEDMQMNSCILNFVGNSSKEARELLTRIRNEFVFRDELEDKARVNIITQRPNGFYLNEFPIDYHDIDFDLYYNEDFKEFHDNLMEKISDAKSEQSFYILHGIPGTGKTSYLRYMMANTKRTVIYLPAYMVHSLSDPGFIDFLANHPNSVLIIEEAEQVVKNDPENRDSGTTNLLNLTDGILGNCFKMDVICTFNAKIDDIDPALKRAGRLDDIFELKELEYEKAKKLCDDLGVKIPEEGHRTLGNIFNEKGTSPRVKEAFEKSTIGFNNKNKE